MEVDEGIIPPEMLRSAGQLQRGGRTRAPRCEPLGHSLRIAELEGSRVVRGGPWVEGVGLVNEL